MGVAVSSNLQPASSLLNMLFVLDLKFLIICASSIITALNLMRPMEAYSIKLMAGVVITTL